MGYDVRAVKVSKSIKRMAASYLNNVERRGFIKSYVRVLEEEARTRGSRNKK